MSEKINNPWVIGSLSGAFSGVFVAFVSIYSNHLLNDNNLDAEKNREYRKAIYSEYPLIIQEISDFHSKTNNTFGLKTNFFKNLRGLKLSVKRLQLFLSIYAGEDLNINDMDDLLEEWKKLRNELDEHDGWTEERKMLYNNNMEHQTNRFQEIVKSIIDTSDDWIKNSTAKL